MIFLRALKALSAFSLNIQYRIADIIISPIISTIPNNISRLIDQNIRMCFPEQDRKAQMEMHHMAIKHTCYLVLELAAVWCWPAEKILAKISSTSICENFTQSKKGRIVIVPHLGNWELLNLWLARESDFMCLYKPQSNTSFDRFILKARSRNGAKMLPIDSSGLRQLSRGLKQGKTAMILPDQRPKKDKARVMANFFGRETPTSALIHNLCRRIDCDVFIASIFRIRDKASFSITIEPLAHDRLATEQQHSLNYMNEEIERLIRRSPEQYQWGYTRFPRSNYHSLG